MLEKAFFEASNIVQGVRVAEGHLSRDQLPVGVKHTGTSAKLWVWLKAKSRLHHDEMADRFPNEQDSRILLGHFL